MDASLWRPCWREHQVTSVALECVGCWGEERVTSSHRAGHSLLRWRGGSGERREPQSHYMGCWYYIRQMAPPGVVQGEGSNDRHRRAQGRGA